MDASSSSGDGHYANECLRNPRPQTPSPAAPRISFLHLSDNLGGPPKVEKPHLHLQLALALHSIVPALRCLPLQQTPVVRKVACSNVGRVLSPILESTTWPVMSARVRSAGPGSVVRVNADARVQILRRSLIGVKRVRRVSAECKAFHWSAVAGLTYRRPVTCSEDTVFYIQVQSMAHQTSADVLAATRQPLYVFPKPARHVPSTISSVKMQSPANVA